MYAKIQIFQIEGKNSKNWLCSDTDNVKTSMYTKMKQFGQSVTEKIKTRSRLRKRNFEKNSFKV